MATMQDVLNSYKNDEDIRYVISVSGGKDSAALAVYMRLKYPELPCEYVFCDTECELPETYDYLAKMEALLGCEIKRITAKDYLLNIADKPNRNSFDIFLNELYGGFLPSPRSRWCTSTLKIKPFEKYIGDSFAYSFIGIRGDEDREGYIPKKNHIITATNDNLAVDSPRKKPPVISHKSNIIPVYPFKEDGLGLDDIKEILEDSGLGLPKYYEWRSRSGCYFCFYQQIGEWQGLLENHPDLFKKAMKYENAESQDRVQKGKRNFTWVEGKTLDEIAKLDVRYEIADMDETEGCAICHL